MSQDAAGHWLDAAGRHPLLTAAEELHLGAMLRAWQDHPDGPDQAPAAIVRRGRRARDRMVAANLRLVAHVARAMRRGMGAHVTDADLADLLQAGAMGLMRGAERFDPARGYKFSTFAYWWIRQGISRWCDSSSRTIRPPSTHAAKLGRLGRIGRQLEQELGRQPSRAELAEALGMSLSELALVLSTGIPCRSLDAPITRNADDPSPLVEMLAAPQPPEDPQLQELRARVAALPVQQARIITLRWGLDGKGARTLKALGTAEGLSIAQVKAQLAEAEATLRQEPVGKLLAEPRQLLLSLPTLNNSRKER